MADLETMLMHASKNGWRVTISSPYWPKDGWVTTVEAKTEGGGRISFNSEDCPTPTEALLRVAKNLGGAYPWPQ